MAEASKTCSRCKEPLPLSSFHKNKCNKDGHHHACKECRKAYDIVWEASHKELRNKKNKEYRANLKKQVYDHYKRRCTCCGETEEIFLSVDHINEDGAEQRRIVGNGRKRWGGGEATYTWIIRHNFPDTFQILCINCNWAKSRGGCPHQKTSKLS